MPITLSSSECHLRHIHHNQIYLVCISPQCIDILQKLIFARHSIFCPPLKLYIWIYIQIKRLYNLSYKRMDISLSYIYLILEKNENNRGHFFMLLLKTFFVNTNITSKKRILKKLILANFYFSNDYQITKPCNLKMS